jgi:hypothetical protein
MAFSSVFVVANSLRLCRFTSRHATTGQQQEPSRKPPAMAAVVEG